MLVLGIHSPMGRSEFEECGERSFGGHDTAAVLMKDGDILGAVEEERLSRIKHTNFYPRRAIQWVLDDANVRLSDVDMIAVNRSERTLNAEARFAHMAMNAGPERYTSGRQLIASRLAANLGVTADLASKFRFCPHHLAHAWSAFFPSQFEQSLILVVDGDGEDGQGGVACGFVGTADRSGGIDILRVFPGDISLGNAYTSLSSVLGYRRFDEYKVMGLAPYGDPSVYRALFARFYQLLDDGGYRIIDPGTALRLLDEAGLVERARRKGEPFEQVHKDFAAALQEWLEIIVLHIVTHFQRATGARTLCYAGGVAHNCSLNGKILASGLFDDVFVQPAAHDAGGAYGAAIGAMFQDGVLSRPRRAIHLYTGPAIGESTAIRDELGLWARCVSFEELAQPEVVAAHLLAKGEVLGWVQGRAEFGPRALGNRSILGDPRPLGNKARINEMVKMREGYRPFAPSVLEKRVKEFFEVPRSGADLSNMLFVLPVRKEYQSQLAAVTHVDGSARVQTVSKASNPRYWALIHEFEKLTGFPIVLNTSFNNDVEPIVTTVAEAISCFLTTGLSALIVDRYLVRRLEPPLDATSCLEFVATMVPGRRLIQGAVSDEGVERTRYALESTSSGFFSRKHIAISRGMFRILLEGKSKSIGFWARKLGLGTAARASLAQEVLTLWQQRVVALRPLGPEATSAHSGSSVGSCDWLE